MVIYWEDEDPLFNSSSFEASFHLPLRPFLRSLSSISAALCSLFSTPAVVESGKGMIYDGMWSSPPKRLCRLRWNWPFPTVVNVYFTRRRGPCLGTFSGVSVTLAEVIPFPRQKGLPTYGRRSVAVPFSYDLNRERRSRRNHFSALETLKVTGKTKNEHHTLIVSFWHEAPVFL